MKILAIITRAGDALAQEILAHQQAAVADLTGADPDYDQLLDQIFAADSVQVF